MILRASDLPEHVQHNLPGVRSAKPKRKSRSKNAADTFDFQLRSHGFTRWQRECMFAESIGRKWRFDFATREITKDGLLRLAVEIEGLVVRKLAGQLVVMGRHASITGFKEDAVKYASAAVLGWQVMRFEQSQVFSGEAIAFVERWYAARGIARSAA